MKTLKKDVTAVPKVLPQKEFQKCFKQWQHRWAKDIAAQEEYFEGVPSGMRLAIKSFRELHSHTSYLR
jgi:hypothetical protein